MIPLEIREIFMGLKKAKQDFVKSTGSDDTKEFIDWLNETYGVQMYITEDNTGYYLQKNLDISDERKYMFFVLKYAS